MARTISYREAINEALALEMERDPSVIVMGEDNAGGEGSPGEEDAWGGVLGVTKGLYHRFPGRVLDTPISESAFVGAAVGAATAGMRPVAELMFIDFMGVCFDQIFNQAAKFRYMFGGKAVTPVVIRTMYGAGLRIVTGRDWEGHVDVTHLFWKYKYPNDYGRGGTAGDDAIIQDGTLSPWTGNVVATRFSSAGRVSMPVAGS